MLRQAFCVEKWVVQVGCREGRLIESERVNIPVRSEIRLVCTVFNPEKSHVIKLGELGSSWVSLKFCFRYLKGLESLIKYVHCQNP